MSYKNVLQNSISFSKLSIKNSLPWLSHLDTVISISRPFQFQIFHGKYKPKQDVLFTKKVTETKMKQQHTWPGVNTQTDRQHGAKEWPQKNSRWTRRQTDNMEQRNDHRRTAGESGKRVAGWTSDRMTDTFRLYHYRVLSAWRETQNWSERAAVQLLSKVSNIMQEAEMGGEGLGQNAKWFSLQFSLICSKPKLLFFHKTQFEIQV